MTMLLLKVVDETNKSDDSKRRYLGNISVPHTSKVIFRSDGLAVVSDSNCDDEWLVELTLDQYTAVMNRINSRTDWAELIVIN